jgi:hypothetical protein
MIENERQYRVAKEQAARLEAGLARLETPQAAARGIAPELLHAERAGVRSVLARLREELDDYEAHRLATVPSGPDPAPP